MRPLCETAWELARRSTTSLTPTQGEIDSALALVLASGQPLYASLGHLPVAAPWFGQPVALSSEVTNPAIAAAWRQGTVTTGVGTVDAVLETIGAVRVTWTEDRFANVYTHRAIATMNVENALAAVPGIVINYDDFSVNAASSDVSDEGVDLQDGARRVLFHIGWFNCPVGCTYLHFWRTKLMPDGEAVLLDEWGEPIPADVLAMWAAPEP